MNSEMPTKALECAILHDLLRLLRPPQHSHSTCVKRPESYFHETPKPFNRSSFCMHSFSLLAGSSLEFLFRILDQILAKPTSYQATQHQSPPSRPRPSGRSKDCSSSPRWRDLLQEPWWTSRAEWVAARTNFLERALVTSITAVSHMYRTSCDSQTRQIRWDYHLVAIGST